MRGIQCVLFGRGGNCRALDMTVKNTKRYARHLAAVQKSLVSRQVGIGSPASRTLPEGFDRDLPPQQMREFLLDSAECFALVNVRVALEPLAPILLQFCE